jgi:hypothetical protein
VFCNPLVGLPTRRSGLRWWLITSCTPRRLVLQRVGYHVCPESHSLAFASAQSPRKHPSYSYVVRDSPGLFRRRYGEYVVSASQVRDAGARRLLRLPCKPRQQSTLTHLQYTQTSSLFQHYALRYSRSFDFSAGATRMDFVRGLCCNKQLTLLAELSVSGSSTATVYTAATRNCAICVH